MPLTAESEPSTSDWVREQVDTHEATDGAEAKTLRETGIPVVIAIGVRHQSRQTPIASQSPVTPSIASRQEVGVAVVAGVLLDHVDDHPARCATPGSR